MLTVAQKKLIRSLATKKGRTESGFCLVEGKKNIKEAGKFLEYTFTPADDKDFAKLVGTVTPQPIAGVARIPQYTEQDVLKRNYVVVLDGVQDPGNVGTILRLCLAFDAALLLIESADPASPKVVRASAGAFFHVPWLELARAEADVKLKQLQLPVIRLENSKSKKNLLLSHKSLSQLPKKCILIAGSEGQGIQLKIAGTSLAIAHNSKLESLNVATALAIVLGQLYQQ